MVLSRLHDSICSRSDTQRQQGEIAQDPDAHSMLLDQLVLLHVFHTEHYDHTRSAAGLTVGRSKTAVSSTLMHALILSDYLRKRCILHLSRSTCSSSSSFSSASCMSMATSWGGRLKLSMLKAYTLTQETPISRHHSSASSSCMCRKRG